MKGPYFSGEFGREIKESFAFLMELPADHEYIRDGLEEVLIDRNLSATDAENMNPEFMKTLLLQSPAMTREMVWVAALIKKSQSYGRIVIVGTQDYYLIYSSHSFHCRELEARLSALVLL